MPTEKQVSFVVILNWRTGAVRLVSGKRYLKLNLTDIPIRVSLTLIIPERQELTIKGEVKLSEAQILDIAIDAFERTS